MSENLDELGISLVQRCKVMKVSIPRILSFNLACVDKFECNLALPGTTEPVKDKDMLLSQIIKKIFSHLCENIMSSGKDMGRSRAAPRV